MQKLCDNCGASVTDTARFCNKCGTRLSQSGPMPPITPPSSRQAPYYSQPPSAEYIQSRSSGPTTSSGLQPGVIGLLCYILGLVTGIIFLVIDPYNKDRFIRFHAFQAIFLHVTWIALYIILGIFDVILPWGFDLIVSILRGVVTIGGLALWILVMVKAYNGEKYKIPVIGDIAEQQAG